MMVTLKCPTCNADLQVDESREFCFCEYCGTKVVNMEQKISGTVSIDNTAVIQNLMARAIRFEQEGKLGEAEEYYNRVLDIDATNVQAREGADRLGCIITEPNVFIECHSDLRDDKGILVKVNVAGKRTVVRKGEKIPFTVPIGKHRIDFRASKAYHRDVVITDKKTKINIIFTIEQKRNHITMY